MYSRRAVSSTPVVKENLSGSELWGWCLFNKVNKVRLYSSSKYQLCLDGVVGGCTDESSMYHMYLFLLAFRFYVCLGIWAVNHRWKKKEKVNYMLILNLFLLQTSNSKTGLVENRFKVLKCQCYAHGLNYFSQWRNMEICSNNLSVFSDLTLI